MALHSPANPPGACLASSRASCRPTRLALAITLFGACSAWAQTPAIPEITVTDTPASQVSGFADVS